MNVVTDSNLNTTVTSPIPIYVELFSS